MTNEPITDGMSDYALRIQLEGGHTVDSWWKSEDMVLLQIENILEIMSMDAKIKKENIIEVANYELTNSKRERHIVIVNKIVGLEIIKKEK